MDDSEIICDEVIDAYVESNEVRKTTKLKKKSNL